MVGERCSWGSWISPNLQVSLGNMDGTTTSKDSIYSKGDYVSWNIHVYIYIHIYIYYKCWYMLYKIYVQHIFTILEFAFCLNILWKHATEQIDLVKVSQHSSCSLNLNMLPSLPPTFVKSLQVTIKMMGLKSKTAHIWNIYPWINPVTSKHQST